MSSEGFAEADAVFEQRFVGNFVNQSPLEPHSAIAQWNNERGTLTLWSSTQVPHYLQKQLSRVFEMPLAKFRIIKPYVGGGFGGKAEAMALDFCSAYLSRSHRAAGEDDLHPAGDVRHTTAAATSSSWT